MKNSLRLIAWIVTCMLTVCACASAAAAQALPPELSASVDRAVSYLASRMDETVGDLYVYKDYAVNENHFVAKGRISAAGLDDLVYVMDENWRENPAQGASCIRCRLGQKLRSWGGWLFINGLLKDGETVPTPVWGDVDGCTLDLSGADALTFMARGELGGEQVEFFVGGLGRSGETGEPTTDYPDSTAKQSTGILTLTKEWQQYTIPLADADLSSIGCGFGFVSADDWNVSSVTKDGEIVFYLDDICFHGDCISADTPRFIASYETGNSYIQNAAFTYDNALCAMAFMAAGQQERARLILDAFVFAIENDRYASDRVRNAYVYGSPEIFPGWGGHTRLPGFMMDNAFYEDRYQVGSNLGNTSFAVLALLQYYARFGGEVYLTTAKTLVDFALNAWTDAKGDGFFAGYDGWPENGTVFNFTYKSTEHNLDFYAACLTLYQLTGGETYRDAAQSALRFLDQMYDRDSGLFWTGTTEDGVTPNTSNIVLDVQVWTALALGDAGAAYAASVRYAAEQLQTPGGGYAFSEVDRNGGYWLEGTAFTALAFRRAGMEAEASGAFAAIAAAQLPSGGLPAVAGAETIDTGFDLFTGEPWVYSADPHIAPVAWYVMAAFNFNPYAVGEPE